MYLRYTDRKKERKFHKIKSIPFVLNANPRREMVKAGKSWMT